MPTWLLAERRIVKILTSFCWEDVISDRHREAGCKGDQESNQGGNCLMECGVFEQRILRIQERGEAQFQPAARWNSASILRARRPRMT